MSTTIVTYAVLIANEPIEDAVSWHPYQSREEAEEARKNIDKAVRKMHISEHGRVPHRVIEVRCQLTELEGT